MSDKTEQPTQRRLKRARERGDRPVSSALSGSIGFVAALAVLPGLAGLVVSQSATAMRAAVTAGEPTGVAVQLAGAVVQLSAPIVGVAALAGTAAGLVQSGGVIAPERLSLKLERLNPLQGLSGLFSWQRVVSVVRALVAAGLVGWLALRTLLAHAADLAHAVGNLGGSVELAGQLSRQLLWLAALVGLALGGVDLLLTRRAWLQRNRMTKDEVKREYREAEGNPEVRAARRRAHQEALTGASIGAVKNASVLIVNPTHLATALRYAEEEDAAPRVMAQGQGEVAKLMLEAARAYGVPIVRDVPVARALQELEAGDEIPEVLYEAVAEILREIWSARDASGDEPNPQA